MTHILIVRPEPAATRSVEAATRMGLDARAAPIFTVEALNWEPLGSAGFGAILFTSANAARLGGSGLEAFKALPCYAVGAASAEAARAAGFADIRTGDSDGAAILARIAVDGIARVFHPCGQDHAGAEVQSLSIVRRAVYVSRALDVLPADAEGAIVLLHSPRAARHFAALVDRAGLAREHIRLIAISAAAADAAGQGWKSVDWPASPRDDAMLELAAKLCQTGDEPDLGQDQ